MSYIKDTLRALVSRRMRSVVRRLRFPDEEDRRPYAEIFEAARTSSERRKLVMGIGGGRCGMRWFLSVLDAHENCVGPAERFPSLEAFYRFVTYHRVPIDMAGFIGLLRQAVNYDWQTSEISTLYSPFVAFGLEPLLAELAPTEIVLHLRRPEAVVNSLFIKGWYSGEFTKAADDMYPGPQPLYCKSLYHNFSRILPKKPYFDEWSRLTRIGKISWYFVTIHDALIEHYDTAEGSRKWIMKLEDIDQNYDYYRMFSERVGLRPVLSRRAFLRIKGTTPNVGMRRRRVDDWTAREKADFESIVGPFYDTYGALTTTWQ